MKKIKLPDSYTIDYERLNPNQKFGSAIFHPLMEIINFNRLQVIKASNELENKFNSIIKFYFFGNNVYKSVKRYEFESMILGKSWFSLNSKKNIVLEIMNEINIPTGKDKEKFQNSLRKFLEARNKLAHGHLFVIKDLQVELAYYNGAKDSEILDDSYFDKLVEIIELCFSYTEQICKALRVDYVHHKFDEIY